MCEGVMRMQKTAFEACKIAKKEKNLCKYVTFPASLLHSPPYFILKETIK